MTEPGIKSRLSYPKFFTPEPVVDLFIQPIIFENLCLKHYSRQTDRIYVLGSLPSAGEDKHVCKMSPKVINALNKNKGG